MNICARIGLRELVRALASLTLAAALSALIVACGGGGGNSGPVLPTITAQPIEQAVVEGNAATFGVVATGTAPLFYEWSSSPDGTNFAAIAGATSTTYSTGATALARNGTRHRVIVANGAGTVTSSALRNRAGAAAARTPEERHRSP